jgi:hypothetical protein
VYVSTLNFSHSLRSSPRALLASLGYQLKDRLGDQSGGSEWEPIKILLEGDLNSDKMNSLGRTPKSHTPHFYLQFAKTT